LNKQDKWNERYLRNDSSVAKELTPSIVLKNHASFLPQQGKALDLACGLGANALFLAEAGLITSAWDSSDVAISRLEKVALKRQINLSSQVRDVCLRPPEENSFDVIVVSFFLHRPLFPELIAALKLNGVLFYQTFVVAGPNSKGPRNPNYRLNSKELLLLTKPLKVLYYAEPNTSLKENEALADQALLIAQKVGR